MPKVKTSLSKKSKKLVSAKRFKFSRLQVLLLLMTLSIIGVVVIKNSLAAGTVHVYHYKDAGIGHHAGHANTYYTANGNRPVWEENADELNGQSMWFGPYYSQINGQSRKLRVCWDYILPAYNNAQVIFDVVARDASGNMSSLYNPNRYTKTIPYTNDITIWTMAHFCVPNDIQLGNQVYYKLEIRAKVVSEGGGAPYLVTPNQNAFKMYATSWQLL